VLLLEPLCRVLAISKTLLKRGLRTGMEAMVMPTKAPTLGEGGVRGLLFGVWGEGEDLRGPHCGLGDAPWMFSQGWMLRCGWVVVLTGRVGFEDALQGDRIYDDASSSTVNVLDKCGSGYGIRGFLTISQDP
jgi:hypothetical protein